MRVNYITPAGYKAMHSEYERLFKVERPQVVEVVSWAAGNGDRSENGDYIYGRMKLRDIDRQLRRLSKKMKDAKVIDPATQIERDKVLFGAMVELADEDDARKTYEIVGDDEADASIGRIGWNSPLARALRGAKVGDLRTVHLPAGDKEWEVVAIRYPE